MSIRPFDLPMHSPRRFGGGTGKEDRASRPSALLVSFLIANLVALIVVGLMVVLSL